MSENFESIVGLYDTMERAENAVRRLDEGGLPITRISIVARHLDTEKKVIGFVTPGDVAKRAAGVGAWTGGIFGLLVGAAFLWIPGFGPMIVAGPLAAALIGGLQGAAAGGASAGLLGALIGWGVSKQHILKYEQSVNVGKFLVVYHGPAYEVRQADDILKQTEPIELDIHAESATAVSG